MITVLILGTSLGAFEFAVGLHRLRGRLRAIEAEGQASGGSLAFPALLVLGGAAAFAAGLALLPFAAAGATPAAISGVTGGVQIALVGATAVLAWLVRGR